MQRSSRSTATGGPPPPSFTGMIVVTGNNGDLPLATQRRVESIASGDRPSPSLDRIYQLGLWLAIFFAIFHRLPPNKFLRFRRTFHPFRSGWLCYFCYSSRARRVEPGKSPSNARGNVGVRGSLYPPTSGRRSSRSLLVSGRVAPRE